MPENIGFCNAFRAQEAVGHKSHLGARYTWAQEAAGHESQLGTRATWAQEPAGHKRQLGTRATWAQEAVGHKRQLGTRGRWAQDACQRDGRGCTSSMLNTCKNACSVNATFKNTMFFDEFAPKQQFCCGVMTYIHKKTQKPYVFTMIYDFSGSRRQNTQFLQRFLYVKYPLFYRCLFACSNHRIFQ